MARYYLETYGCTSNRGESRQIEAALRDAGHRRVDTPREADVALGQLMDSAQRQSIRFTQG